MTKIHSTDDAVLAECVERAEATLNRMDGTLGMNLAKCAVHMMDEEGLLPPGAPRSADAIRLFGVSTAMRAVGLWMETKTRDEPLSFREVNQFVTILFCVATIVTDRGSEEARRLLSRLSP